MQRKRWYAIQTYAGSELRLKHQLEERVRHLGWQTLFEPLPTGEGQEYFFVPVEEVVTSRSGRGRASEYRVPYDYDLLVTTNERIQRGALIARRPPKHLARPAEVVAIEPLWRVVVETPTHAEIEYLLPQEKGLRRDVRVGEKTRPGLPLTVDSDERYVAEERGQIVARERVKRLVLRYEDGAEEERIIPEAYLSPQVRLGAALPEGAEIEREHKLHARASGLIKVKEYKDKREVSVQRIEKRRLIPGYVFAKMGLDEGEMFELLRGLERSARFVGSKTRPVPIEGPEILLVQRKAGLVEAPQAAEAAKAPRVEVEFEVGEVVQIVEGPFADFTGEVREIDKEGEEAVVMVKIFGRETPVRISFDGIAKV
ncbi:KOW motif-containing protein [Candidatus Bipolaricaulota bacterium]|nr:KOW motif-containing protein [Candidatus Bipolaricaulota bacterium]